MTKIENYKVSFEFLPKYNHFFSKAILVCLNHISPYSHFISSKHTLRDIFL